MQAGNGLKHMQSYMDFLTCYLSQRINFRVLAKWWFKTLSKEAEKSKQPHEEQKIKIKKTPRKTTCPSDRYFLHFISLLPDWDTILYFYPFIFYLVLCENRFLNIFVLRKYPFIGRWRCFWLILHYISKQASIKGSPEYSFTITC